MTWALRAERFSGGFEMSWLAKGILIVVFFLVVSVLPVLVKVWRGDFDYED